MGAHNKTLTGQNRIGDALPLPTLTSNLHLKKQRKWFVL